MPEEKIQGRSGFPENTERSHRLGLCLTDELELRFLENLREHGRTKDTISVYRRNLSRLRKSLPEDSKLDPAFLSNWQCGGHEFDPHRLHQINRLFLINRRFIYNIFGYFEFV